MLVLTDKAVDVIKQVVEANELPEGAGLRVAVEQEKTESGAFAARLAEAPESDDEIVEVEGARVFLDPIASPELDDKVLDAQVQPTGGVTFGIARQGE